MTHAAIKSLGILEDLPLKLNVEFTEDSFFEFCQINRELRIERDKNGTIHIMTPTGFETGRYNADVITDLNNWNRKNNTGIVGDSSTGYTLPNGAVRSPVASWVSNERLAALSKEQLRKFPPVCPDFVIEIRSPSDNLSKLRACLEAGFDSEKSQFLDEMTCPVPGGSGRRLFEEHTLRYGQKKQRSVIKKMAFAAQRLASKQALKKKMKEYMENGCRLAWLIDLGKEQVFIYKANGSATVVNSFSEKLSGEEVLPGFELELPGM